MADWKSALAALGATERTNDNKELMEQREQSQACLNYALQVGGKANAKN